MVIEWQLWTYSTIIERGHLRLQEELVYYIYMYL